MKKAQYNVTSKMAKKPWNMEKMENERDVSTFGETDEKKHLPPKTKQPQNAQ